MLPGLVSTHRVFGMSAVPCELLRTGKQYAVHRLRGIAMESTGFIYLLLGSDQPTVESTIKIAHRSAESTTLRSALTTAVLPAFHTAVKTTLDATN